MAYWYNRPREPENTTMWTPEGAPYLINLNHPQMLEAYHEAKRHLGMRHNEPMSDALRFVWEADMIGRYGRPQEMPEHIIRRILLPPYRHLCEGYGVDIGLLEQRIKKRPPKRSAVS